MCVLLHSFKCCFNKQLCDLLNLLSVFLSSPSYLCSSLSLSSFQASYASSDLYNLNGLSSSRNPGSAFNGYQVCMQTKARPSERHMHLPPQNSFLLLHDHGWGSRTAELKVKCLFIYFSYKHHCSFLLHPFLQFYRSLSQYSQELYRRVGSFPAHLFHRYTSHSPSTCTSPH